MLTLLSVRKTPIRVMAALASENPQDTILVVPEQLSHEAERTLSRVGGASVCLKAEVLSFTRLAQRVASLYGGAARKHLDGAGRILAMRMAVEELRPRLKYFASALARTEFLHELVQVVDELKSYCVEPSQLLDCARAMTGRSAQKFEELGLILESYAAVCAATAYDPKDQLSHLAEQLKRVSYADSRCFILGGFQDFTAQQMRIIESLLLKKADVTVLLCDDMQTDSQVCFASSRRTARQLQAIAARCSCSVRTQRLEPAFFPEQAHLLEHLYGGALWPWEGECENLSLHTASNAQAECKMATERVFNQVRNGARYRDFGVVVCSDSELMPMLQAEFERLGIPYFCTGRSQIGQRPLPMLVLSALEAVSFGYRRQSVVDYLRSGLSCLTDDEVDCLENYAIAWNIRGSKWHRAWTDHPDGYDGKLDEAYEQKISELNGLRVRAAEPLRRLEHALRQARTLRDQTQALYSFVAEVDVSSRLEQMVTRLQDSGHLQASEEETQMYSIFVEAMQQLYTLGNAAARSVEDFYRLVKLLLEQYDVSSIPAVVDSVTIGALEDLRGRDFAHLLMLGAKDGAFPAYAPSQSLITEEEREMLLRGGVELPMLQQNLDRQILSVYNVLSCAQQSLFISCASDSEPSYLFKRFLSQFPMAVISEPEYYLSDFASAEAGAAMALSDGIVLPRSVQDLLHSALLELDEKRDYSPGSLDLHALKALYGDVLRLSPSRIDRLASCRCGYYLEYGLKLEERKEYRFDAPVFGTFVHDVLEHTVQQVTAQGGFRSLTDEQIRALAEENIANFTRDKMQGLEGKDDRFVYLYHRNREEIMAILSGISREMRRSSFEPVAFELRFAPGGDLPAVQIPDTSFPAQIIGVVDRADLYKTDNASYLRIVDYKTGRKSLDYADLTIGVGLQMLIYLFSMQKTGLPNEQARLQPAGVLYLPAREPFLSMPHRPDDEELAGKRRTENRRKGLISDDEMLLQAMEENDGKPEFMPYKVGKEGPVGDLASREQWHLLENHVQNSLKGLVEQIAEGDVTPNPYQRGTYSSCNWCAFEPICRFASGGGCMRSYEEIKASEFWAQLEKEAEERG